MTKYSKIPRGLYVDPNNLDDNNLTNVPVNPEDLSIYVELTTTSKSRSRIVNEKLYNSGNNIGKINFINGSQFGNSECDRSLTTSYTDISTTFDKPSLKITTRCHSVLSFLSLVFLSRHVSEVAKLKLTTLLPSCVVLISGSLPNLPINKTLFKLPAIQILLFIL